VPLAIPPIICHVSGARPTVSELFQTLFPTDAGQDPFYLWRFCDGVSRVNWSIHPPRMPLTRRTKHVSVICQSSCFAASHTPAMKGVEEDWSYRVGIQLPKNTRKLDLCMAVACWYV